MVGANADKCVSTPRVPVLNTGALSQNTREDPFLWQDARGHWHILAHTWCAPAWPAFTISGHAFSEDLLHWTFSMVEPYGANVTFTDGSVQPFATLERPKVHFWPHTLVPAYITNGASPQWPCAACKDGGRCSACKVSPGLDWTYTLIRPFASAPPVS